MRFSFSLLIQTVMEKSKYLKLIYFADQRVPISVGKNYSISNVLPRSQQWLCFLLLGHLY